MIMLLAKPIVTITAWITMEVGAVLAFLFSMFAQVNPNPLGFDQRSSMVLAYASFITAIAGGIVAVIQVITTARNAKTAHELELVRKDSDHKQELAELRDRERQREIEILKEQSRLQNEVIIKNNAWIQDVKAKHPAEGFGSEPAAAPDPEVVAKLATPIYPHNFSPSTPKIGQSGTEFAEETKLKGEIAEKAKHVLEEASEVGKKAEDVIDAAQSLIK